MADVNRRLELWEFGKGFHLTERDIPTSPDGGLVVKTCFVGLCHSDALIATGQNMPNDFKLPRVLGHEISGRIQSMGPVAISDFPDLHVGDRVALYPCGTCMSCRYCRADHPCCDNDMPETAKMKLGFYTDGGFQNYVVIDYPVVVTKVPDGLDLAVASLIMCGGMSSLNALQKIKDSMKSALRIKGKATVALFGMGGLALWGIQLIRILYPGDVIVVGIDIHEDKLSDAKAMGADVTHCWNEDAPAGEAAAVLISAVGGHLDAAIDYTGLKSTIERAFKCLTIDSTLVMVGLAGKTLPADLPLVPFILQGISIRGSNAGTMKQAKELMQLTAQGKVKPPPIEYIGLDDVEKTLHLLGQGKQRGRAIIKF